jgi:hypothetical protein
VFLIFVDRLGELLLIFFLVLGEKDLLVDAKG